VADASASSELSCGRSRRRHHHERDERNPFVYNDTSVPANSFGLIQVHSSSTIGAQFFG
jgi:hypothetical protein